MRRFKRNAKNEEGRELIPAQKDGDGAMPEPSFEGVVSNRTFSRREAVGLTGAALAGFAALAATNASPAVANTAESEATSARGTAAKPKVIVKEAKIEEGKAKAALAGVGSLLKHRQYWGKFHGQRLLTLNWAGFSSLQQVYVSSHEGFFIGAARYTVHNVAPRNGAIDVWVNVEWGSDINVYVDYLIVG
jgi:hypothetical protein